MAWPVWNALNHVKQLSELSAVQPESARKHSPTAQADANASGAVAKQLRTILTALVTVTTFAVKVLCRVRLVIHFSIRPASPSPHYTNGNVSPANQGQPQSDIDASGNATKAASDPSHSR